MRSLALLKCLLALLLFSCWTSGASAASNYSQNFDSNTAAGWTSSSYDGAQTFTATGGYYTNDNHNTLWSIATYGGDTWTSDFTYTASLNSQFGGGTANAVGMVYGFQDSSNYYKIWFNMQGEADIYKVSGGTQTQVAHSTNFTMTAKTWFSVQITRTGTTTSVSVNGTPLFSNISQPEITTPGKIGVIAEWNYAEFDNIAVTLNGYSENFNNNTAANWSSSSYDGTQTFSATSGYYTNDNHNTSWTIATYNGNTWNTNFTYSVDLNSQFGGGTANAVGAVYGYQDSGNYYKVWFNMQGEADLYRVSGGTATQVAHTTSLSMTAKTWFTVKITRSGSNTSITVNSTPLFTNVSQPEITTAGKIGVIAEWNFAEFDNVVVTGTAGGTTLYATDGPTFPRLATIRIGGTFNYQDTAVQQNLAQVHIAFLAYYKGWDNSSRNMNSVVTNIKADSPFTSFPTKVFLYINDEQFHDDGSDSVVPDIVTQLDNNKQWLYNQYSATAAATTNRTHDPQSPAGTSIFLANTTKFAKDSSGNQYGWVDWYANWVNTWFYQPNTAIDGFFTDNFSVQPLADGDYNEDGTTDSASNATVGGWWRDGLRRHITTLSSLMANSSKYQLGNIGDWGLPTASYPEYTNLLNGGVLEGFIGKPYSPENNSWTDMLGRYRKVMAAVIAPKLLVFSEWGALTDYQTLRYGLASCMMDDGYFSFTDNAAGYGSTPLFDEYKVSLGYPTDPPPTAAWSNGVWRRNFQNGIVLVNPRGNNNNMAVTVQIEPGYKHFSGTQDSTTNNGLAVTSVTLQPRDGVILIKAN